MNYTCEKNFAWRKLNRFESAMCEFLLTVELIYKVYRYTMQMLNCKFCQTCMILRVNHSRRRKYSLRRKKTFYMNLIRQP